VRRGYGKRFALRWDFGRSVEGRAADWWSHPIAGWGRLEVACLDVTFSDLEKGGVERRGRAARIATPKPTRAPTRCASGTGTNEAEGATKTLAFPTHSMTVLARIHGK
jgi:hypothetical protein